MANFANLQETIGILGATIEIGELGDPTVKGDLIVGDGTGGPSVEAIGTNGQVLTADSVQTRGLKWATPAAEANTASNIGIGGVGVFDAKVGVDLQFRNINAGSSKISITDDSANDEIDVDVVEASLDLANIGGELASTAVADHTRTIPLYFGNFSLGGVADPGQRLINISSVYFFSAGADKEVFTTVELPRGYKNGSNFTLHFVWSPHDATAGNVIWAVDSKKVRFENSELITGAVITATVTDATNSTQDELLKSGDITITGTGFQSEDILFLRLFRNGAAAGDTYTNDANLHLVGVDYTADSLGT